MQKNEMKKELIMMSLMLAAVGASAQDVMKKQGDGTVVVNTTTLAKDVRGYQGATPVEVYINKKGVIVKVEALGNQETPKHLAKVKKELLPKYAGVAVKKFEATQVDGVTGATLTSNAVKANVARGVAYYQNSKKKK